jgi:hypothetical protein
MWLKAVRDKKGERMCRIMFNILISSRNPAVEKTGISDT